MTHPHHLSATAAAWSLADALAVLERRARDEARDIAMEAPAVLRSSSVGRRHALGGHGDPTGTVALNGTTTRRNRYAELLADLMRELDQLAAHLPGAHGMDPLQRIRQTIPSMRAHVAAATGNALQHLDGTVRRRLQLPPALEHLTGLRCPVCRVAQLYRHTADPSRPIVCRADCLCRGSGCPCGMPVVEEGAPHIWPAGHPAITSDRAAA